MFCSKEYVYSSYSQSNKGQFDAHQSSQTQLGNADGEDPSVIGEKGPLNSTGHQEMYPAQEDSKWRNSDPDTHHREPGREGEDEEVIKQGGKVKEMVEETDLEWGDIEAEPNMIYPETYVMETDPKLHGDSGAGVESERSAGVDGDCGEGESGDRVMSDGREEEEEGEGGECELVTTQKREGADVMERLNEEEMEGFGDAEG